MWSKDLRMRATLYTDAEHYEAEQTLRETKIKTDWGPVAGRISGQTRTIKKVLPEVAISDFHAGLHNIKKLTLHYFLTL